MIEHMQETYNLAFKSVDVGSAWMFLFQLGQLTHFVPGSGLLQLFVLPWCRERPHNKKQSSLLTLHSIFLKRIINFVKIQKESVVN